MKSLLSIDSMEGASLMITPGLQLLIGLALHREEVEDKAEAQLIKHHLRIKVLLGGHRVYRKKVSNKKDLGILVEGVEEDLCPVQPIQTLAIRMKRGMKIEGEGADVGMEGGMRGRVRVVFRMREHQIEGMEEEEEHLGEETVLRVIIKTFKKIKLRILEITVSKENSEEEADERLKISTI